MITKITTKTFDESTGIDYPIFALKSIGDSIFAELLIESIGDTLSDFEKVSPILSIAAIPILRC